MLFYKINKIYRGDKRGFLIVEILVVIAIITVALVSLLGLASLLSRTSSLTQQITKADYIASGTLEAVRNFRDSVAWNNDDPENKYDGLGKVTTGVAYHPKKSTDDPPRWMLVQGEETIGNFTRKVVFNNIQRDSAGNIVESGGVSDPDTKKVTATVYWQERGKTHQVEIITYLTNWQQ